MSENTATRTALAATDIAAILARVPLFQGLDAAETGRVAAGSTERDLGRGEILFHRGDPSDGFYIVVHGQIKLAFTSAQGNEKVVEIIDPGQSFGEAVMFMDKPYPLMAQALAATRLVHVGRQTLFAELDGDPHLARKMIAGLSMRLHRLINDVESYSLRSARERIIGYLLREADEVDAGALDILLPASKGTIASRLNITQEHFSRLLQDLSGRGLIEVSGRSIRVPDIGRLRLYAGD